MMKMQKKMIIDLPQFLIYFCESIRLQTFTAIILAFGLMNILRVHGSNIPSLWQILCYLLMAWFLISLVTTMLEFLRGYFPLYDFIFYQLINLFSYFVFYYGVNVQKVPLPMGLWAPAIFLTGWYVYIATIDISNPNYSPQLQKFFTFIDLASMTIIGIILYLNIFTIIRVTQVNTKIELISSLEKLIQFGRLLIT